MCVFFLSDGEAYSQTSTEHPVALSLCGSGSEDVSVPCLDPLIDHSVSSAGL